MVKTLMPDLCVPDAEITFDTSHILSKQVWNAQYTAPQFGRKRCPDLQITGPSLREGGRPGSARVGGYTPAADDATTYVSSSYATGYY